MTLYSQPIRACYSNPTNVLILYTKLEGTLSYWQALILEFRHLPLWKRLFTRKQVDTLSSVLVAAYSQEDVHIPFCFLSYVNEIIGSYLLDWQKF